MAPMYATVTNQLSFLAIIGWSVVAILPWGWRSFSIGPLIPIFHVYFGLYQVEVNLSMGGDLAFSGVKLLLEKCGDTCKPAVGFLEVIQEHMVKGDAKMYLKDFAAYTKALTPVHNNALLIQGSSYCLIFCIILCNVFLLVGSMFLHYYHSSHATSTGRSWSYRCMAFAPLVITLGLGQYVAVAMYTPFAFLGANSSVPFDHSAIISLVLCVLTWSPLCVMASFGKEDPNEKDDDFDEYLAAGAGGGYGTADPNGPRMNQGQGMQQGSFNNQQGMQPYQGGAYTSGPPVLTPAW